MSAKASWVATAVGTAVGTGGWIFGLGRIVWPAHPQWALFFVTIAATVVTSVLVERDVRSRATRAQH
jgi:cysteine synthase